MRAELNRGRKEQADWETPETERIGAFLKTTLWELLAIGAVGLATYLMVNLILWLTALM